MPQDSHVRVLALQRLVAQVRLDQMPDHHRDGDAEQHDGAQDEGSELHRNRQGAEERHDGALARRQRCA